jgi:phosphoenolpyruvate synthase/pyruvate phosphate dikinase
MDFLKNLRDIDKDSVSSAGGKGAALGEMIRQGISVPEGFVILSSVFERFLDETNVRFDIDAILGQIDYQEIQSIRHASEQISSRIVKAEIPPEILIDVQRFFKNLNSTYVAVRSSATAEDSSSATWAGQLASYLNVTEDDLFENIKECWASLFTPRALFYRFEQGMTKQYISVAVVIQRMLESEKSGIAFSTHPMTQDTNMLVIEACFGLGESIVSGQLIPDSYVVQKDSGEIIERDIHAQTRGMYRSVGSGNEWRDIEQSQREAPVLSDLEINGLSATVIEVEKMFGFPCDIEWVLEGGNIYLLQSRPITTLKGSTEVAHLFKRKDYMLSFSVKGVSIFVTDIHADIYSHLEALFIIDHGLFRQFFTHTAYEQALDQGLAFYSDEYAFGNYQKALSSHCDALRDFFNLEIKGQEMLSYENVALFFEYTKKLCGDYVKMNFEFTDRAFTQQETNPTIKRNLAQMSIFKDVVRTFMNVVLFESPGYVDQCFMILGKQCNLSPSIIHNMTQEEILNLFTGKRPIESIVAQRQESFVEGYNLRPFLEGVDAMEIIKEFQELPSSTRVFQGKGASNGKVVGIVKIIPVDYSNLERLTAEIERMSDGSILVTETTAPELMIACKKAGAIVTDVGGLMSHAAIISRELSIPCVVGTVNASRSLKDGDRVEVDGSTGVVRVLE